MRRRVKKTTASKKTTATAESVNDALFDASTDDESVEETTSAKKKSAATDRYAKMQGVAKLFTAFRPAPEVLTRVRAVPTIFDQFNHAVRVGGYPIERFSLMHGPSGEGKTLCTLGLIKSFLDRDHFGVLIDAERTTPREWIDDLLGLRDESGELLRDEDGHVRHHPFFFADRPDTYEKTVSAVRSFVNQLKKLRDAGKVAPETSALIVVDSIRKLVPEDIFKKITEASKQKGDDKVRDRSAQIKAAMNATWMDEVVPLLEQTGTSMLVIARETEDPDADARSRMYGTNFKVGSGKAIYYDASLVMRVERQRYVTKENATNGEKAKPTVYGERHRITIRKTKVSGREDKQTVCYFHSSNGVLIPSGFDPYRDVLELALRFGVAKLKGSWIWWRQHKWQGEHAAVKKLAASPELFERFRDEVRSKYAEAKPLVLTEKGAVITDDGEVVDDE